MSEFQYKEEDEVGENTLDVISNADRFNSWMYSVISKYTYGEILEIGSGIGNISACYLENQRKITLSDIREIYCKRLREKFERFPALQAVKLIDLADPKFSETYRSELNKYDSIFALNVVEHIENDHQAIANAKSMLKPGGQLVILVPAYQTLYNKFDIGLEHYRRYTQKSLCKLFTDNKLEVLHRQYFNFIGIFGWYVSGKLMKNDSIPEGQMGLFNTLVPVFKAFDKIILNRMGLSVIAVGKKV